MRPAARDRFAGRLTRCNPDWAGLAAPTRPTATPNSTALDFSGFLRPPCPRCGGVLKPDVVFFGENVPQARVAEAHAALEDPMPCSSSAPR